MDKVQGDVMYAPYSIATSVEGDVLYESEIDSFDRQLNTLRSYQIKSSEQNIISSSGFYTNSNKAVRMAPIRSYPVAYVKRLDGDIVSTSMFNDACDKEVGVRNYKWREIDVSGKPYASLASTVSEQIVRVNQFGMFTSASNFTATSVVSLATSWMQITSLDPHWRNQDVSLKVQKSTFHLRLKRLMKHW